MPTRNVNLTEHLDQFVETGVTSGRFSNASEVLRGAAKEGFDAADRGDYVTLRSGQEIDDFVDRVRREVSKTHVAKKLRA